MVSLRLHGAARVRSMMESSGSDFPFSLVKVSDRQQPSYNLVIGLLLSGCSSSTCTTSSVPFWCPLSRAAL